ncbi:hypothetical protein OSB04_010684 [Centaurea solstitialis]|uniref:Uncharacterized protein n=1 Tax=Centaurea solstitialis TaxID=347529 RepID=A0AA38WKV8_9ASTR|nr:hypothetical protein OSB04_010684 [Centaurea solstitialis]
MRFRQTCKEFFSERQSLVHASKPLELVHTDVCGPMRTTSIGGSRYVCFNLYRRFQYDTRDLVELPSGYKAIGVKWVFKTNLKENGSQIAAPAKSLPSTTMEASNKDTKKKATKKLNLLSFGEEAEEEERTGSYED